MGVIDLDNAGPGARVDDLAYFAYRFAPLSALENYFDGGWSHDVDRMPRLQRICELSPLEERTQIPELVLRRLDEMRQWIRDRAAEGDPAVQNHIGIYDADARYIEREHDNIRAILES
ncbi:hypothetical protein GCM10010470_47090 [Saccharopolyspora taberi]|uniref:Uncharacterized protein n=1 Tax=Saccharopolyspora taberi TaxID=60895 RepID=A0ABN3VJI1_9PSEU